MAILLIRPRGPQYYKTVGPDLGFGYLQAALNRAGREAVIVDLVRQNYRALRDALKARHFSHIGFKLYSKDVNHFREIVRFIRKLQNGRPMPPLVAGGPLPTGLAGEFLNSFPEISYAFKGEAEEGYPLLVRHLESGGETDLSDIPGLIYRQGGEVRANPQSFPADLDELGFPDLSQMPPALYPPDYTTGHPYVTIMTSRGCPCHCSYCGGPLANGHKLRKHSPGYVLDLMSEMKARYDVTMFSIVDDNLTMDRRHAQAVFEGMIQRDLRVRWRAPNGLRLDTLDRELVRLMERSGCEEVYLGIESGSENVLRDMNRRVTVEMYREKVALLAENTRMRLLGFFILGYPTEREVDARLTIDFACELPLHRASFFFFTPHPGTAIYDQMKQLGELPDDIWNSLFYERPSPGSRHIPLGRLKRLQRIAFVRFYLRPRIIWNLLASVKSPAQLLRVCQKVIGTILRL